MISFVNFWSRPPRTVERDVALDILEAEPPSKASIRPPKIHIRKVEGNRGATRPLSPT